MTSQPRTGALAGVKVLDLTRIYPGRFGTFLVADLGAQVLKVEYPGAGDAIERHRRSRAVQRRRHSAEPPQSPGLDLRRPEAADVLS